MLKDGFKFTENNFFISTLFFYQVKTVRYCATSQMEMLEERSEAAGPVFDALNVMGACPWRINKQVSCKLPW